MAAILRRRRDRPRLGPAPLRRTEFGLLLVVGGLTGAGYTLASLGTFSSVPANIIPFLGVILGLFVVAHIATRRLARLADPVLLPLCALLNGVGYVFIVRLDQDLAAYQAVWAGLGVVAFVVTLLVIRQAKDLERYRWTLAMVGIGLLLMPLVPGIGRNINGARIWLRVGPASFQPGEFAKIALAIFFASYLVEKAELLRRGTVALGNRLVIDPRSLGPIIAAWAFALVVMTFENDLGSSLLFFAVFVAMLWVATGRTAYLGIGTALFAAGSLFAWKAFAHVHDRVAIWLNPWKTAQSTGFQIVQSLFAFGAGGIAGAGIGLGSPTRIPEVQTDFIFAAIGEELGLLGATAVIVSFMLIVGAGLRIALRTDDPFEKLLAAGLSAIIGFQSFIIIGGVTRVVPLTGITLPFISYGGSSLLANYVLLALLLRISHDGAQRQQQLARADGQAA